MNRTLHWPRLLRPGLMPLALRAAGRGFMAPTAISAGSRTLNVAASHTVSTFAGSGMRGSTNGAGTAASFNTPTGIAVDAGGALFVADLLNHKIRKITPTGKVTTFAGSGTPGSADGNGTAASLNAPHGLAFDASGNLYVAEQSGHRVRKITRAGKVSTFAGAGTPGSVDGKGTAASFNRPSAIAIDANGTLYVAESAGNKIRKITPAGRVSTFAGSGMPGDANGVGSEASFTNPFGIAVDRDGVVHVVEINGNIRRITPDGAVSTLLATAGAKRGIAIGSDGNLYVSDEHQIIVVTPSRVTTVLAGERDSDGDVDGPAEAARLCRLVGLAFDGAGRLFVGDSSNHKIRKIEAD